MNIMEILKDFEERPNRASVAHARVQVKRLQFLLVQANKILDTPGDAEPKLNNLREVLGKMEMFIGAPTQASETANSV